MRAAWLAVAAGTASIYVLLGLGVMRRPPLPLPALDLAGRALAGEAPRVALVFTASCWWQSLVSLGALALVLAAFVPHWRGRVFFSIIVTLVAWQSSNVLKELFARPRPTYWLLHHETSASYASGHAMFAVVVYGLWSWYVAHSELPRPLRLLLGALAAAWGIAVIWSRLALGAHWITDLIGGVLFGVTMLALGVAVAPRSWTSGPRTNGSAVGSAGT